MTHSIICWRTVLFYGGLMLDSKWLESAKARSYKRRNEALDWVAVMLTMVAGCAETPRQRARRLEPMLAAAGFHIHRADTPQRHEELNSHTPLKVRYFFRDGKPRYWFADPYVCDCIYVGNETIYPGYQELKLQQQNIAREQAVAELNEDAAQQEEMNLMVWPADPFFY